MESPEPAPEAEGRPDGTESTRAGCRIWKDGIGRMLQRQTFAGREVGTVSDGRRFIAAGRMFQQKRKVEDYDSESDSDDDEDDDGGFSKERGDSKFWQKKMRTLHRLLDVNKDGVLSFDDFRLLADKFTSLGHLSQKHHDEFQDKIQEAWELQRGAVDPYNLVTTEQFMEDMHHILNDKHLRRKVHQFLPYFFKAVDKDHSGEISMEEFKLFFECLGLSETDAETSFKAIDLNHDGKLSLKEFVKLGREYLVSENENSSINSKEDYIPVLLWTSSRMPDGPILTLNKINRELFANYLVRKLNNRKPVIVVFMEQILGPDDFQVENEGESDSFPFLGNIPEKVNYFPSVELPYEAFKKLSSQGYKWKHFLTDLKFHENESEILVREFRNVNANQRQQTLRKHDAVMAEITKRLNRLNRDWICIYTGRHAKTKESDPLRQPTAWHADPGQTRPSRKPLYLYKDQVHGLALLTRGPILLHLPTRREHTVEALEDYVGATFNRFDDSMDFVVWFSRYTVTFAMSLLDRDWFIDSINIQNVNGNALKLWPTVADQNLPHKCYARFLSFHSKGKPLVKVELSKYKVVQLQEKDGPCANTYTFPLLCTIMFTSIVILSFAWSIIVGACKIPKSYKSKTIHISLDSIASRADAHSRLNYGPLKT